MKKSAALLEAMGPLALVALAPSALATTFDFTYTGSDGTDAAGTLTATPDINQGAAGYAATNGTITASGPVVDGNNLTGTLIPNPYAPSVDAKNDFFFDDQIYPGYPELIGAGLLFKYRWCIVRT